MVSITTNFTPDELRHINMLFIPYGGPQVFCEICTSAKRKIVEAIELAEIAEHAKGLQEESMR